MINLKKRGVWLCAAFKKHVLKFKHLPKGHQLQGLCLDLGSESFNIKKQRHRRLFIFMIKGVLHQSRINKKTLFIECDIKSEFLSNIESILLHYASRCYMWFWQTGSSERCQLTIILRSRAWQKSQHHQSRNVFSLTGGNSNEEKSLFTSSKNMWIVPLNYPITLLLTTKKYHKEF